MKKISKIAILDTRIITNEAEALEAVRFALDWNGSSEADSPAECDFYQIEDEDSALDGKFVVTETWGEKSNNDSETNILETFDTQAEAESFVDAHNANALASWSKVDWVELPVAVDLIQFAGCSQGGYPKSRIATIFAALNGETIEATGCADAAFLRDSHSGNALGFAVQNLVEKLTAFKATGAAL